MNSLSHPEIAAEERAKSRIQRTERTDDGERVLVSDENTQRHSDGAPAKINPESNRKTLGRQKIGGDIVAAATKDLPDDQRSAIRRLHAHAIAHDLTNGEVGALIRKSDATISLLFRGKYTAGLSEIIKEIDAFFKLQTARESIRKASFTRTSLTKTIWDLCDAARMTQRWGYLFGESQIGKSKNLIEYQKAHNHGSTIYISVPTQGTLIHFTAKLAEILSIPNGRGPEMRRRIINSFDDRMLLIVDEGHRCIPKGASSMPLQTVEFVREIFDEKECGVVWCATNAFRDEMEEGRYKKMLRQSRLRRLATVPLDDKPTAADLNLFAADYKLPPATGAALALQKRVIEEEALGMWLTILRMGSELTTRRKRNAMTWDDVIQAEAALRNLEGR